MKPVELAHSPPFILAVLLAALSACGTETVSQDAGSAPLPRDVVDVTGAPSDVFPPDLSPTCVSNGRACNYAMGSCGECGLCDGLSARLSDGGVRYPPGNCTDAFDDIACHLNGEAIGFQAGRVCSGFQGDVANRPRVLLAADCLRLRGIALALARSGDEVEHCWYSDMTEAVSGVPSRRPLCPAQLGFVGSYRRLCGVGCAACPSGEVCMFSSEVYPTGVCVPRTSLARAVSMPCKAEAPRTACPRGTACFLPVRNDANGIPDRQRWGVCMAPNECNILANGMRDAYLCDMTLVQ